MNDLYGMGYPRPERSKGYRLLTGAMIGMTAGVMLGYLMGRYAPGPDPQWPARFECRDLGSMEPARVRICTRQDGWREGISQ